MSTAHEAQKIMSQLFKKKCHYVNECKGKGKAIPVTGHGGP
jgi:hypothetical protein